MLTTPNGDRELIRSQNRGSRVYNIGGTSLPSVTAIVSAGEPKPALVGWAMKSTAEAAVEQYDLVGQIMAKDGLQAAVAHLKGSPYRQRDAAGDIGSRLHEVAEYELLNGVPFPEPSDPRAAALVNHWRHFVFTTQPDWLAIEAIVYNEDEGYAGTLDAAASLPGITDEPVIIDWKSGSGVYGSFALQLAAYAHSTHIVGPEGHEPLPPLGISRERAVVVHLTPDGWRLIEVDVSQPVFEAFLLCRDMAVWAVRGGTSEQVVGKVLAHGRHTGGKGVKLKQKKEPAPPPAPEVVKDFGARRRIAPPSLKKN